MGFGKSISHVLGNLTNFRTRAGRAEFWWWFLFVIILQLVANTIDMQLPNDSNPLFFGWGLISIVVGVVLFLANLSVSFRRLHDTNRSGWWLLLYLLPCIGEIILIVFWLMPSTPGPNAYGDGPDAA